MAGSSALPAVLPFQRSRVTGSGWKTSAALMLGSWLLILDNPLLSRGTHCTGTADSRVQTRTALEFSVRI